MKVLKLFFVSLFLTTTVYASYAPEIDNKKLPEGKFAPQCDVSVQECISYYSTKYDVPRAKLDYIVLHESSYKENAVGDMDIICKRTGLPVRARGILQITECYYPEIPDSCAFNAQCSLEKMILLIKDERVCASQWTTCRDYYRI